MKTSSLLQAFAFAILLPTLLAGCKKEDDPAPSGPVPVVGRADAELMTAIGYADGFSRAFSRGVGVVLVNGKRAPVVGNVCMDMTMIDVTGINANEGDEVIIFGRDLPIGEIATLINTIPYEILTSTSERVKRVFHAESI